MAIRINVSLAELNRQYTVFERNQVLSDVQLNGVTDYLNDQDRLSRLLLIGVGVHGGLRVSGTKTAITVAEGVGVTTDCDVLWLDKAITYSRFRKYDETAPRYDPFYDGDTMRQVLELIADGADAPDAQPLSDLPQPPDDLVVVLFMESALRDPDLCVGTDCDNLGKNATDIQRVLLMTPEVAEALAPPGLETASKTAEALPDLFADRPNMNMGLPSPALFFQRFADVCDSTIKRFLDFAGQFHTRFAALSAEVFGSNPTNAWTTTLTGQLANLKAGPGVLSLYDHLKDLVDTGNELREVLLADDTVLCPDAGAFPKHLLLGRVANPALDRTPSFPSPLVGHGGDRGEHARLLARKLGTLIATFKDPGVGLIRVTPSRTEAVPLEERAIPRYYQVDPANPVEQRWNYRLARRNAGASNLGYNAEQYGAPPQVRDPLAVQFARNDFFRVEGQIGFMAIVGVAMIQSQIKFRSLPFVVRAVLLGTDVTKVTVKPPTRFTDLDRFHYLLRADVANHLTDLGKFNDTFKQQFDAGLAHNELPADKNIAGTATTHFTNVKTAVAGVQPAMAAKAYTDYRAKADWPAFYGTAVGSVSGFKADLGEYVRTDIATPFDTVATNNQPAWLVWLDQLIADRNAREDAKLTYDQFLTEHPAFEHLGGVPRGGTLVLLYDETGRVVADGALPYAWRETAEEEPKDLPDLKRPDFKPTVTIDRAVAIKLPANQLFDQEFTIFKTDNDQKWTKAIDDKVTATLGVGKSYFQFFQDTAKALVPVLTPKTAVRDLAVFPTDLLGLKLEEVNRTVAQIDQIRAIAARPDLPEDQQKLALDQLATAQMNLANAIAGTVKYMVDAKADVGPDTAGAQGVAVLAAGVGQVSDPKAKTQLQSALAPLANAPNPSHRVVVGNLNKLIVR
jgi:hypothetical protein